MEEIVKETVVTETNLLRSVALKDASYSGLELQLAKYTATLREQCSD